jgi:hypothetical protein
MIKLTRLILALVFGIAAFLYALYRILIGDEWVGLGVMVCTLWVARALAGPFIDVGRS